MKIKKRNRKFQVGLGDVKLMITDCAAIDLKADEAVTFTTPAGGQYDVTRKNWGFFATPSLNKRLPEFNLRPVLMKGRERYFIMLVERGKEKEFYKYRDEHFYILVQWLDEDLCGQVIKY